MNQFELIVTISLFMALIIGLTLVWSRKIGLIRASLAGIARFMWLLPIFFVFFPVAELVSIPQNRQIKTIDVIVDDSESMKTWVAGTRGSGWPKVKEIMEERCLEQACQIKEHLLSKIDSRVDTGVTPLVENIEQWHRQTSSDGWVLFSDGADWQPQRSPSGGAKGLNEGSKGLIVGVGANNVENIWIDRFDLPVFSFDQKPIVATIGVRRSGKKMLQSDLRIQTQIQAEGQIISSQNSLMKKGENSVSVKLLLPSLPRGQRLLKAQVLGVPDEQMHWDNVMLKSQEVLPNTVGLLHLLGSPSWDGRFLRRYFKSEPKFDLISFFILRDRWDSQAVNERELSLIPFPVERLFNEELPNFKAVVVQNFALYEFLQPEYQENLVSFVKNGGGLLFIGGPRSLQPSDLYSSALAEILPFEIDESERMEPSNNTGLLPFFGRRPKEIKRGPYYDESISYRAEFAAPRSDKRALVSVLDEWRQNTPDLEETKVLRGIHRIDRVKLKPNGATTLINAVTSKRKKIPLVVASYPGKGRALWVFSDSFWRLAFDTNPLVTRSSYSRFLSDSMTWLLRNEMRQPLYVRDFSLGQADKNEIRWSVVLAGAAARYFRADDSWQIKICNEVVDSRTIEMERTGGQQWSLRGVLRHSLNGGDRCAIDVQGIHRQFGSVKAHGAQIYPKTYRDDELAPLLQLLETLARKTNAQYIDYDQDFNSKYSQWVTEHFAVKAENTLPKTRVQQDHFWIFKHPMSYLFLMMLPLEVLIRRWHKIVGGSRRHRIRGD
jgi:hypothetical protein